MFKTLGKDPVKFVFNIGLNSLDDLLVPSNTATGTPPKKSKGGLFKKKKLSGKQGNNENEKDTQEDTSETGQHLSNEDLGIDDRTKFVVHWSRGKKHSGKSSARSVHETSHKVVWMDDISIKGTLFKDRKSGNYAKKYLSLQVEEIHPETKKGKIVGKADVDLSKIAPLNTEEQPEVTETLMVNIPCTLQSGHDARQAKLKVNVNMVSRSSKPGDPDYTLASTFTGVDTEKSIDDMEDDRSASEFDTDDMGSMESSSVLSPNSTSSSNRFSMNSPIRASDFGTSNGSSISNASSITRENSMLRDHVADLQKQIKSLKSVTDKKSKKDIVQKLQREREESESRVKQLERDMQNVKIELEHLQTSHTEKENQLFEHQLKSQTDKTSLAEMEEKLKESIKSNKVLEQQLENLRSGELEKEDGLALQIRELETQNAQLHEKIKNANVPDLHVEIDRLRHTLEELQNAKAESDREKKDMEQSIQNLQDLEKKHDTDYSTLYNNLNVAEGELELLREEHDKKNSELAAIREERDQLADNVRHIQKENEGIREEKMRLEIVKSQLDEVTADSEAFVKTYQDAVATLKQQLASKNEEINALQGEKSRAEVDLAQQIETVARLESDIVSKSKHAEQQHHLLQERETKLEQTVQKLTAAEENVQKTETELAEQKELLKNLRAASDTLETTNVMITTLESQNSSLEEKVRSTTQALQEIQEEAHKLKQEKDELTVQVDDLCSRFEHSQKERDELQSQLKHSQQEKDGLHEKCLSLEEKTTELQSNVDQLKHQNEQHMSRVSALEMQIDAKIVREGELEERLASLNEAKTNHAALHHAARNVEQNLHAVLEEHKALKSLALSRIEDANKAFQREFSELRISLRDELAAKQQDITEQTAINEKFVQDLSRKSVQMEDMHEKLDGKDVEIDRLMSLAKEKQTQNSELAAELSLSMKDMETLQLDFKDKQEQCELQVTQLNALTEGLDSAKEREEQASQEQEKLQQRLITLAEEKEQIIQSKSTLETRLASFESPGKNENEELELQLSELLDEKNSMEQQIKSMTENIDNHNTAIANLQNECDQWREQVKQLEAERDALSQSNQSLSMRITDLEENISNNEQVKGNLSAETEARAEELNATKLALKEQQTEIHSLRSSYDALIAEKSTLDKELDNARNDLTSAQDSLEQQNHTCNDLGVRVSSLEKLCADAMSDIRLIHTSLTLDDLNAEQKDTELDIDQLREELSQLREQCDLTRRQHEEEVARLKAQNEALGQSQSGLEGTVESLESEHRNQIIKLEETKSATEQELSELQDKNDSLQRETAKLHEETLLIAGITAEKERLQNMLNEHEMQVASSEEKIGHLEDRILGLEDEKNDLLKDLQKMESSQQESHTSQLEELKKSVVETERKYSSNARLFETRLQAMRQQDIERFLLDNMILQLLEPEYEQNSIPITLKPIILSVRHWRAFDSQRNNTFCTNLLRALDYIVDKHVLNINLQAYWLNFLYRLMNLLQADFKEQVNDNLNQLTVSPEFETFTTGNDAIAEESDKMLVSKLKRPLPVFATAEALCDLDDEVKEREAAAKENPLSEHEMANQFTRGICDLLYKTYLNLLNGVFRKLEKRIDAAVFDPEDENANADITSPDGGSDMKRILSLLERYFHVFNDNALLEKRIIVHFFEHIAMFIDAYIFNSLMKRPKVNASRALQIKMSVSFLMNWFEDNGIKAVYDNADRDASSQSHLLLFPLSRQSADVCVIAQKTLLTDQDMRSMVCPALTVTQIAHLLSNYAPEEFDSSAVSQKVLDKLNEIDSGDQHLQTLFVKPQINFHQYRDPSTFKKKSQSLFDFSQGMKHSNAAIKKIAPPTVLIDSIYRKEFSFLNQ